MTRILLAIAATASLVACNKQDHTIVQGGNDANEVANTAAPVVLPPAIAASKTYRCKDNSLVYLEWLADNVTANFRAEENAAPLQLKAPAPGEPLVAEGYSLTGSPTAASITLTRPGKGSQSCKG